MCRISKRNLTMRSSRNCIATPSTWRKSLPCGQLRAAIRLNLSVRSAKASSEGAMIRSLVLIAVVIAFTCTAAWAQSPEHDTSDVGQVYRAFLDNWVGDEKSPINVSMSIKATSVDDVEEFADCAGNSEADWARADAIDDLRPLIGALSYLRLVDPRKWSPRD